MSNRAVQGALCFQSACASLRTAGRMPFSELALGRSKQVLGSCFVEVHYEAGPIFIRSCASRPNPLTKGNSTRSFPSVHPLILSGVLPGVVIPAFLPHLRKQISLIQSIRSGQSPGDKKQSWDNAFEIFGHIFKTSVGHFIQTRHLIASAVRFLLLEPRGLFLRAQA